MSSVLRAVIVVRRGAGNIHIAVPSRNSRRATYIGERRRRSVVHPSVRRKRRREKERNGAYARIYVCVRARVCVREQHEHCQSRSAPKPSRSILSSSASPFDPRPGFVRETTYEIGERHMLCGVPRCSLSGRRRSRKTNAASLPPPSCVARERAQERARGPSPLSSSLFLSTSLALT